MRLAALAALWLAAFAPAAGARPVGAGKVIFQAGAWRVQVIGFRDGAAFCVAEVMAGAQGAQRAQGRAGEGARRFSLWSDGKGRVRLVFASPRWDFRGGRADLGLRIDTRAPWRLEGAVLLGQSAVFELQDPERGSALLRQLREGRRVVLLGARGQRLGGWSLWGSGAALDSLAQCDAALRKGARGGKEPRPGP